MSTHDDIEELADLAAAGAWEADGHATSCASCAATLAAAREFRAWASGAITPDAPPADLEERVIARFRAGGTAAARRLFRLPGKRFLKWVAGSAAAVGLVVLGGTFAPSPIGGDGYLGLSTTGIGFDGTVASLGDEENGKSLLGRSLSRGENTVDNHLDNTWAFTGGPTNKDNGARTRSIEGTVDQVRWSESRDRFSLNFGFAKDGDKTEQDQRDVAGLRDYNEALERDNVALRGKAMAVDGVRKAIESETLLTKLGVDAEGEFRGKLAETRKGPVFTLDEPQLSTLAAAYDKVPGQPVTDPKPASKTELNDLPGVDLQLAQEGRKLIRNARLTVEVEAYEAAQTKVAAAAAEEKGFVASADTERLQNGKIRATVTLRVPPERFEALLAKLRALGTVKQQSLGTQDVTKGYVDMEARLGAKQALLDRLKKVLAEAKGNVKELMEVEVQMGATLEQIEALKGELKYLDNQVGLATISLELAEKDLGQPFEYVQTLQSRIGLVTSDVDKAYAEAQKAVLAAGGQVVDSKMTRQNDGAATGTIRARVEAAKFPDVRQALRALGHVETDTVDQQKTARGGEPTSAAPVRVEQATIDLSVTSPALVITRRAQIRVETKDVEAVYLASRKTVEAAGGRVLDGGLSNRSDGGSASLTVQVDVDKFSALVDAFKASGEVKHAVVNQSAGVLAVPVRERAEVLLQLQSPPSIIGEEHGIARIVRETFGRSWAGLLWSIEKLFVGLSLAGPWALAVVIGWLLWRRARRRKPAAAQ